MSGFDGKTIVLIAGQPKAGTTSLYNWLAQHPQVGAGKLKEIRFLLDGGYPLPTPKRYDGANLEDYLSLFNHPDRPVLLDASPDYLGCSTPLTLPSLHANSKAILIFRDPVGRMISAYRFYRSRGFLPNGMSFDGYIEQQDRDGVEENTPSHFRALDHCRKQHYAAQWSKTFGSNLLVLDFADLRRDSRETLAQVCDFIGIDPNAEIDLTPGNKTTSYRSGRLIRAYGAMRRRYAQLTMDAPFLYKAFKPIGQLVTRMLQTQSNDEAEVEVSEKSRQTIARYASSS
ncbi:MAG: sulfotransferase [Erythrobacter sp.]